MARKRLKTCLSVIIITANIIQFSYIMMANNVSSVTKILPVNQASMARTIELIARPGAGAVHPVTSMQPRENITRMSNTSNTETNSGFLTLDDQLCEDMNTSTAMCNLIQSTRPLTPKTLYPLQLVSGAPGSGNDWILWLGAVYGYETNQEDLLSLCEAYHINRANDTSSKWIKLQEAEGRLYTHCPYIKTHEPWFKGSPETNESYFDFADRAALILRHPYDSALSEFKRTTVVNSLTAEEKETLTNVKLRTDGLKLDYFLDNNNRSYTASPWRKYYKPHIQRWLEHARYWLMDWKKPLRVIIYKDFTRDVDSNLNHILNYFGYTIDQDNIKRHCCILKHTVNKKIKRKSSVIDEYKEMLLEKDTQLRELCDNAIRQVHAMLDKRWPGVYRVERG